MSDDFEITFVLNMNDGGEKAQVSARAARRGRAHEMTLISVAALIAAAHVGRECGCAHCLDALVWIDKAQAALAHLASGTQRGEARVQ